MATNEWTGFRLVPLLILTLSVFGLGRGLSVVPPGEIVYQMSAWNDTIGIVTKSLNHSQTVLSVVGVEVFSDPPTPIGGTWVGPLRRLPYTILFVVATPLFSPDYTEAFRIAYRIGYTFTALVAYPLTGFAVYKLGRALADHRAGALALTLFVCQEIVGWPINPLYRLKPQHTISIPICLFALWAAVRTLQSDDRPSSDRYAVIAGALLGVGGLTQYHHTLVSIVGVVGAFLVTRRLRLASRVVVSGLVFGSFYIIIPAAGVKIVTKAIGVFGGDGGGGSFVTLGGVVDTATTPGVAILLIGLVCTGLLIVGAEPLTDGYLFETTLATTWLLWLVPKFTQLRDAEAVISLWFLEVLLVVYFSVHGYRLSRSRFFGVEDGRLPYERIAAAVVWVLSTVLLFTVAPINPLA